MPHRWRAALPELTFLGGENCGFDLSGQFDHDDVDRECT
jgi:hypothetical protein